MESSPQLISGAHSVLGPFQHMCCAVIHSSRKGCHATTGFPVTAHWSHLCTNLSAQLHTTQSKQQEAAAAQPSTSQHIFAHCPAIAFSKLRVVPRSGQHKHVERLPSNRHTA